MRSSIFDFWTFTATCLRQVSSSIYEDPFNGGKDVEAAAIAAGVPEPRTWHFTLGDSRTENNRGGGSHKRNGSHDNNGRSGRSSGDSRRDSRGEGKYWKRRRSNVAVIIVRIVFMSPFLFYCLLLNHSFPTNPNRITNCFKLILSLFTTLQLHCSCVAFWFLKHY